MAPMTVNAHIRNNSKKLMFICLVVELSAECASQTDFAPPEGTEHHSIPGEQVFWLTIKMQKKKGTKESYNNKENNSYSSGKQVLLESSDLHFS
jgi:hypothetical protein